MVGQLVKRIAEVRKEFHDILEAKDIEIKELKKRVSALEKGAKKGKGK